MRSRISITLGIATLSLAAVACTALLGDFEEGADGALSDATVDATIADTSMDTNIALDSNAGEAGLESGADASADTGSDAAAVCLPTVCVDGGPNAYASCFSFDNLNGAVPPPFTGGPAGGYGDGSPGCGQALSLLKQPEAGIGTLELPLPAGGATLITFDILVNRASLTTPPSSQEIASVFGPSGTISALYSIRLSGTAAPPAAAIGLENIPDAMAPAAAPFQLGVWTRVSITLTRSMISLGLNGAQTINVPLPADLGSGRGPSWYFGGLDNALYTGIYVDNLVIVTTPFDAGP